MEIYGKPVFEKVYIKKNNYVKRIIKIHVKLETI